MDAYRVLHTTAGAGGSGSTRVVVDLALAHQERGQFEDRHGYSDRQERVLAVARFARTKDFKTLIRAAGLLRDWGVGCQVLLAGTGNPRYQQECRALSRRLGLCDLVRFLGARDDVPALLHESRVFVLPTHGEGLGLAVLEAMAAGCLAIGSRVMGVSELIEDGVNGYLVRPRDPVMLAERIKYALENPDEAQRIAARGQAFVRSGFTRERMVREYEELFLAVLAGKGHGPARDRGHKHL